MNLDILDDYQFTDEVLIEILKNKVADSINID